MEKRKRSTALGAFTRNERTLNLMFDEGSPTHLITPQYEKLQVCWNRLEDAHDAYIESIVGDIDDATMNSLDEPAQRYQDVVKRYSTYFRNNQEKDRDDLREREVKDREEDEKVKREAEELRRKTEAEARFDSEKAELQIGISAFKRLAVSLKDSVDSASDSDKRRELEKLESNFITIKSQLVKFAGIDPSKDITDINGSFVSDVEAPFIEFQKHIVTQLKDSSSTSGGVSTATSDSGTKRELIKLPLFQGGEKSKPFVNFPVWKSQWDIQIDEYPEKHRAGLLKSHVDEAACSHFIGYEGQYEEMMKRLVQFYGDKQKIVKHVLAEVLSPSPIAEGDYNRLVTYSTLLEQNYNRLTSMKLQNQMSNISIMTSIIQRFPRLVTEKWHQHLLGKSEDEQVDSFPVFISWISTEKSIWERMSATSGVKSSHTHYVGDIDGGGAEKKCFGCGEVGHLRRQCPSKTNSGGSAGGGKPRKLPLVKKFWCALHKGDPSKKCSSQNCTELRKLADVQKRIQLLKENGDCLHCCGDHLADDCRNEERICGGGKSDRGCSKSHKLHELFCKDAKVFACTIVGVAKVDEETDEVVEGVILCIMVVSAPNGYTASVFWDSGATSNFVREAFAKLCGFSGTVQTLSVTTLGGVVTEYLTVIEYNCSLIDKEGNVVEFKAYGLESITGVVSKMPVSRLRKLFPGVQRKTLNAVQRGSRVDFLIGLPHPSWHPNRTLQARGGGDFWLYESRFGMCVGGRHPEVYEGTQRSDDLFTVNVNHAYAIDVSASSISSHELEFCPSRSGSYEKSRKQILGSLDVSLGPVSSVDTDAVSSPDNSSSIEAVEIICTNNDAAVDCVTASPFTTKPDDVEVSRTVVEGVIAPSSLNTNNVTSVLDESQSVACHVSSVEVNVCENDTSDSQVESILRPTAAEWKPGDSWLPASDEMVQYVTCAAALTVPMSEDRFFQLEALGTTVNPECGGCRCGKCPVPGSVYSFKEQTEYDKIMSNLVYRADLKRWFTTLPWKSTRSALPRNMKAALKMLKALEKSLEKNPELAEEYNQGIRDMVARGSAVLLSEEVVESWNGDYYYLPIVGVKGKKSLRICFDASRKQCGCESMNYHLCKGPDRFMNDLLSVLLAFRNGRVGCAGDIRKFHNQVHLMEEDTHMQRFLWRFMETDQEPQHFAIPVNNFGVKPANCIATCALRSSADQFSTIYPVESEEVKNQTYVDDQLTAAANVKEAVTKTQHWDEICAHASMPNGGWTITGDKLSGDIPLGGDEDVDKRLGQSWNPGTDDFLFRATLRVKLRGGGPKEITISTIDELLECRDAIMNRRMLLSNVQSIFDPLGLLSPILLQAKLLLRETWTGSTPLGWDDPLPDSQAEKWMAFLKSLLEIKDLRFQRSLWPKEEVVGQPMLIIFSDGAATAFGVAAYIRWELQSGGFWTRLIMGKSKIAPKNILSIPRMELNGAVLGNRVKNYILKHMNIQFSKVYQLVDSSTVLGYVHKECGLFHPYEGIRVSELQSSNQFVNGRLVGWAWIPGVNNPADWCTKPRKVKDLLPSDGFWQAGAAFLLQDEKDWPIVFSYRTDRLDGEMVISKQCHVAVVNVDHPDLLGRIVNRISSWKKMCRVLAWILRLGVPSGPLTAEEIRRAKQLLLLYAQKEMIPELKLAVSGKGRYRRLAPVMDDDGLYRVGSRVRQHVPFTLDSKLPVLLPTSHIMTLQIMRSAHKHSHVAQDGTLCRFRMEGYWAVRAGSLAKKVASACVDCRKKSRKTIAQPMGEIPAEQLKQPVAWGHCQMDLMGPFHCRGDVNPRTTKKTWGLVIEDCNSGAVHLDVVSDYSTNAVLMSLRRFGSLRGWPGVIQSDPGSQLESASGKLESWWSSFCKPLQTFAGAKNFEWKVSPPDSPWRQGKAERRIGVVKRILHLSVGDTRVSPLELQTILMEAANICNERPLGLSRPRADGTYNVLTPNNLLLGRSVNILPDDAELSSGLGMRERYRVVNHVTSVFWQRWSTEVTPQLIFRQKWHEQSRNLCAGDVVLICETSNIKAKYKLAIVEGVHTSSDGFVRSATLRYSNINGERCTRITVKRSVQRLVLVYPVEEQEGAKLEVEDLGTHTKVCRSPVKAGV